MLFRQFSYMAISAEMDKLLGLPFIFAFVFGAQVF
jgi:hypothetical protein